ncbi:helix-turn-helix domain-containing protein, partial [Undibacterium sp.]|uniref:helix-turn-helix domain-containing protein n=1 Tax=Undibacterium sp. TaxID=1914977 RepID=UPI0037518334
LHLRLSSKRKQQQAISTEVEQQTTTISAETVELAGNSGERMVRKAQKLLLEDLSSALTLVELARFVGTNERRLTEEFRRYTGLPVFQYLRQERFRRACELLLHSDMQVSIIADTLGFQTAAAFSFAFRSHFGMTPSQYRQTVGMNVSQ